MSRRAVFDFDPWADDADAAIDRIVAEGGAPLEQLRAFIAEGEASPAAPWEDAEALKRRARVWREEQSRLLDAALPAPGSPEEAEYIAAIRRSLADAEAGRMIDHAEVRAKLERIGQKRKTTGK